MIIHIDQDLFSLRYLKQFRQKAIGLYFSGANVAYRRDRISEIGGFDEKLMSGEDIDIGIRLSENGKLFSNPTASVVHTADLSFRKLVDQWWKISSYQILLLSKFADKGIEVFISGNASSAKEYRFRCVYYRTFPFPAFIFLTSFLFMNFFAWCLALSFFCSSSGGLALSGVAFFVASCFYFYKDFAGGPMPILRRCQFLGIRLLINFLLLYVPGVMGIFRGILYINYERT
jgi:hypothetical protein